MDLVVDLQQQARPANPFPTTVQWFQDGALVSNDSDREFSYPTVTFLNVNRLHGGVYSLRATNFLPNDPSEVVGTGVGSFTLDVLCKCRWSLPSDQEEILAKTLPCSSKRI